MKKIASGLLVIIGMLYAYVALAQTSRETLEKRKIENYVKVGSGNFTVDSHIDLNTKSILNGGAGNFSTVDTGQGANELYDMNQNVQTTDAVTFSTVNTGNGANELYAMNQNVQTTNAVIFSTVDTGQGANELYDMDQNVLTTSTPTFAGIRMTSTTSCGSVASPCIYLGGTTNKGLFWTTTDVGFANAGGSLVLRNDSAVYASQNIYAGGSFLAPSGIYASLSGTGGTGTHISNASHGAYSDNLYIGNRIITTQVSDERYKNFKPTAKSRLAEVLNYDIKDYTWKSEFDADTTTIFTGMSAQKLHTVRPDLVRVPHDEATGLWSINSGEMVYTVIKAMQEQQVIIQSLQNRIEQLENAVN